IPESTRRCWWRAIPSSPASTWEPGPPSRTWPRPSPRGSAWTTPAREFPSPRTSPSHQAGDRPGPGAYFPAGGRTHGGETTERILSRKEGATTVTTPSRPPGRRAGIAITFVAAFGWLLLGWAVQQPVGAQA